jgi:hypothetical protein
VFILQHVTVEVKSVILYETLSFLLRNLLCFNFLQKPKKKRIQVEFNVKAVEDRSHEPLNVQINHILKFVLCYIFV